MKLNQLLLFSLCLFLFACNIESIGDIDENLGEENNTTDKRVTELIGYVDGNEIAKLVFSYADNKLSYITEYKKSGTNWVELSIDEHTYNSNSITAEYVSGNYQGNKAVYQLTNNYVASISYIEDGIDYSGYDDVKFNDGLIRNYTFYEGDGNKTWYYKAACEYDGDNIKEINEVSNSTDNQTWTPATKTTFNYSNSKLSGWTFDYVDDDEYDEKIDYLYNEDGLIEKTVEHSWSVNSGDWAKLADINYTYDDDGYLIEQSITEYDSNFYQYTSNHLFDYVYVFETIEDYDTIKFTYEEGKSNNHIFLYPEFFAYKTPNPFVKF